MNDQISAHRVQDVLVEAARVTKCETAVETEERYVTGRALWALVLALFLVVVMMTLDISILATAIPRITDDFNTIEDIGWYASAYLITNCALQPFAGRIYSFFPFKPSFLTFVAIFELGSLLSGVSTSSTMLIIGRAVCGIGSSGLTNGSMTAIGIAAPPSKRSVMLGLFVSIASAGQVIGPLVGGALTQYVSWRWCFYINLPIGGIAVICFLLTRLPPFSFEKNDYRFKTLCEKLDAFGLTLFAPASVMLLMALEWGGTVYRWGSATIIGLLCGSAVTFILFVEWERRHGAHAMVPTSIIKIPAIYGSCLTAGFQGASMLILTYYLALWFQVIDSQTPTISAVSILPSFLAQVVLVLISTFLIPRIRYLLPPLALGNVLVTTSYGLFSTFKVDTNMAHWIGYQVLAGAGRGMSLQIPILGVQASVDKSRIATVTALVSWSQFLGGAIALALSQTLFQNILRSAMAVFAPQLNVNKVIQAGATGFVSVVPPEYLESVRQAYNEAIAKTFYLGIGAGAASLGTSLLVASTKVRAKSNM